MFYVHSTNFNNYYYHITVDSVLSGEEALKNYDEALSIDPNAVDVLINKGLILIELLRYEEAIDVFDKILSIDPKNVDGLYNKGVALEKLGMSDESVIYLDQALQINPDYSPRLFERVSTSIAEKMYSAAL